MAELCIVCLGELRSAIVADAPSEAIDAGLLHDASDGRDAEVNAHTHATRPPRPPPTPVPRSVRYRPPLLAGFENCLPRHSPNKLGSIHLDAETIAHLLPCKHDLHNACLTPWVERANSCPICRSTFNMVELSRAIGGPVLESYAVQDKVQEAELDATMVVEEDELFAVEAWEPCIVCGSADEAHGTMYCDGCDKTVHVFCAGFDDAPDVWYCENCLVDLESDGTLGRTASAMSRRARSRPASARPRRRRNRQDAVWARVWQEVSRRLDLDLDFPFDEAPQDHRTDEQRREFASWQRRFEVASRQGASNRLREIANTHIRPTEAPALDPESQQELRAWNQFEKARESQDAPASVRRLKRKTSVPPASPNEPDQAEQPQQKRPRLRRPPIQASPDPVAESSHTAAQRIGEEPTFLHSLLREVESKPAGASSPGVSEQHTGQFSPVLSPSSSTCGTPRALSPQRPLSPPLSSSLVPTSPPNGVLFSPFSPVAFSHDSSPIAELQHRGRKRASAHHQAEHSPPGRASSSSPSRNLSYSAKQELQRMVKLALRSRYRDKEITKEQYTDINRDVSRKLYDLVQDATALADQEERERWQAVADEEVKKCVTALSAVSPPPEEE